jgi:hypothetical protein
MSRYDEELELINKLSLLYSICEGTTSREFIRVNKMKIEVMNRKNEELNQKESIRKATFFTSAIPLE